MMKKVLLSSLLKPADDVRMYQKLAISLLDTENIDLVVVGRAVAHKLPTNPRIKVIGAFSGKRDLLSRLQSSYQFWKILVQEQPETLINSSPDFLLVTVLYKIIFGGTLGFDIQENHLLNLRTQGIWKGPKLWISAIIYKTTFRLALPIVDAWILAEEVYEAQMPWLPKEKLVLLENKFKSVIGPPYPAIVTTYMPEKLCYTGTIAYLYGTLEAISLAETLHATNSNVTLTIGGYCQDTDYWKQILTATKDKEWITIIGGTEPIEYAEIEKILRNSDTGILSYLPNESFKGKVATKFYELSALGKLILISNNTNLNTKLSLSIANNILNTNYDLLTSTINRDSCWWYSQNLSIILLNRLLNV